MTNDRHPRLRWLLAAACFAAFGGNAVGADPAPASKNAPLAAATFAKVDDTVITYQEYDLAFAQAARGKFYHGKPPEGAVAVLQREVGQSLVDDILLAKEARRLNVQPDPAAVQRTLDGYEQRYGNSEQWKNNRERLLPGLRAKLARDNVRERLEKQVKEPGEPTPRQLHEYWEKHKDKFTAPEQVHLSLILLKVDPSSPKAKWDGARAEGAAIIKRLRTGADFKELAKLHSGDPSAERGGDMGFVHQGMLPEPAQQAVDKLKPGEIGEAVTMLEGVAVFRLEARKVPVLNPLEAVRDRARDLWKRDRGEENWAALLVSLRRNTPVKVDESRFLPLATASTSNDNLAPR